MFTNIGGKIKTLAKVICWIGIISSVIAAIVVMNNMQEIGVFIGLSLLIFGPIVSYVSSLGLYGFGQLVENSDITAGRMSYEEQVEEQQRISEAERAKHKKEVYDKLDDPVVSEDFYVDLICPQCDESISFTKGDLLNNKTVYCPNCDCEINVREYITTYGQCQMCGKDNTAIHDVKIVDDKGARYRKVCDECLKKLNCTKV